jgi:hypothetical protein
VFVPEKRVIKKYDREDVRVDDKYIQGIMRWITDRDIQILRLLLRYPFMTAEQIEMMVFSSLKPSSWRNKANERLRRLYHCHCIDRWFPPVGEGLGSSQQHVVLDRAGAKILALKGEKEAEKWKKRKYVPQTYSHSLKIFDFRAMLSVLQKQADFQIKTWRMEKKNAMKFPLGSGKKGEVQPDALCIYSQKQRLKAFFLECDNDTMDDNQLKSKIQRYVQLYKSEEWKTTDWAKLLKAFPPVLIIMHNQESIRKLNAYIHRIESNIRFYLTTYDSLMEKDTLVYENARGKTREVTQDLRIRLLEPIFIYGEGRVAL